MSHEPALAQYPPDHPAPAAPSADARLRTGAQAALVALSVYVAIESLSLGLWSSFGPGAGFFPFVLGVALGALSVAWFFQSIREGRADAAPGDRTDVRHAVAVLVSLVVLAAVMDLLGYQISMFLFLMFHLKWRAGRSWALSLVLALVGSAGVFYGFEHGLMVQLPPSAIPFLAGWGL
ncbi:tripartite tricarboxylate transporter TctB family protein [Nonomuraea sp. NPDC049129]|uniref:tripartite tricarboxylate transporter TctB family protein n=1 Tax=Nonomuraea sp. NPDC049129 TaxID=3155272 RepID=UPI0033E20ABD